MALKPKSHAKTQRRKGGDGAEGLLLESGLYWNHVRRNMRRPGTRGVV